jgi:hypothetical protein
MAELHIVIQLMQFEINFPVRKDSEDVRNQSEDSRQCF